MSQTPQSDHIENATETESAAGTGGRTFVPQFALDAADAKLATWSNAIVDAADSIDRIMASETLPVPDSVRELATSTTQKLRGIGQQAGDHDAAELVTGLQKTAAAHPAATIGIGAAVGVTLAALLVRLGAGSGAAAGPQSTTSTA